MTVRTERTLTATLGWDGKTSPTGAPPSFLTNHNPGSAHGRWHGEKETGGLTLTLFPVTTESRRSFPFSSQPTMLPLKLSARWSGVCLRI